MNGLCDMNGRNLHPSLISTYQFFALTALPVGKSSQ